jgi:hypothetical protein
VHFKFKHRENPVVAAFDGIFLVTVTGRDTKKNREHPVSSIIHIPATFARFAEAAKRFRNIHTLQ